MLRCVKGNIVRLAQFLDHAAALVGKAFLLDFDIVVRTPELFHLRKLLLKRKLGLHRGDKGDGQAAVKHDGNGGGDDKNRTNQECADKRGRSTIECVAGINKKESYQGKQAAGQELTHIITSRYAQK